MISQTNGCVEFRIRVPGAKSVYLVGDFNDWQRHEHAMASDGNDHWKLIARLPAGAYRFRYFVENEHGGHRAGSPITPRSASSRAGSAGGTP